MDILKKIVFATVEESGGETLTLSYRSGGVITNTGTLCTTENIDTFFYMLSSTPPTVTTGDIAYNTNNQTSPFNGGNKYYNVEFSTAMSGDSYIVQIDSSGVMTVIDFCGT